MALTPRLKIRARRTGAYSKVFDRRCLYFTWLLEVFPRLDLFPEAARRVLIASAAPSRHPGSSPTAILTLLRLALGSATPDPTQEAIWRTERGTPRRASPEPRRHPVVSHPSSDGAPSAESLFLTLTTANSTRYGQTVLVSAIAQSSEVVVYQLQACCESASRLSFASLSRGVPRPRSLPC